MNTNDSLNGAINYEQFLIGTQSGSGAALVERLARWQHNLSNLPIWTRDVKTNFHSKPLFGHGTFFSLKFNITFAKYFSIFVAYLTSLCVSPGAPGTTQGQWYLHNWFQYTRALVRGFSGIWAPFLL